LYKLAELAVQRRRNVVAAKLHTCAGGISSALDRHSVHRELRYLEDALLQARREGVLPTDFTVPDLLTKSG
jgi:hypothetical protein